VGAMATPARIRRMGAIPRFQLRTDAIAGVPAEIIRPNNRANMAKACVTALSAGALCRSMIEDGAATSGWNINVALWRSGGQC